MDSFPLKVAYIYGTNKDVKFLSSHKIIFPFGIINYYGCGIEDLENSFYTYNNNTRCWNCNKKIQTCKKCRTKSNFYQEIKQKKTKNQKNKKKSKKLKN